MKIFFVGWVDFSLGCMSTIDSNDCSVYGISMAIDFWTNICVGYSNLWTEFNSCTWWCIQCAIKQFITGTFTDSKIESKDFLRRMIGVVTFIRRRNSCRDTRMIEDYSSNFHILLIVFEIEILFYRKFIFHLPLPILRQQRHQQQTSPILHPIVDRHQAMLQLRIYFIRLIHLLHH